MHSEADREQPGLMPLGQPPYGKKTSDPNMRHAVLMMVVGCVCIALVPFLGAFFFGFGARELITVKGKQGVPLAAGVGVIATAVAALLLGVGVVTSFASLLISAIGVAWCMERTATVNNVTVVVVLAAAAEAALMVLLCAMQGTTPAKVATETMMAAAASYVGTGAEADFVLAQIQPVVAAIWPSVYVMSAVLNVGFAAMGSHVMSARCGGRARMASVANFDMPLWPVGVLAVSVVGLGVSFADFPGAQWVLSLSLTALLGVRVVFALQGFGVVTSLMNRFRFGCAGRMLCVLLSIWLETMCFVVSIVGLIDVWANFRKLSRGGSRREATT